MLIYNVIQRKNPFRPEENKFYAKLIPVVPADIDEISTAISNECTITEHDIRGVLSALEEQIYMALRDGRSVRLGQLGCFIPTLTSRGTDQKQAFTPAQIKALRCTFRPSSRLRSELSVKSHKVKFKALHSPETNSGDVIV